VRGWCHEPQHPAGRPRARRRNRRFLRTSYRFLDERLRRQFEEHIEQSDVIVRGPYVTLAREFERGRTLDRW
jgi:hypothetical protein